MQSNSRICLLCINADDISGRTSSTTCGDTDLSPDIGTTASIINNKVNKYSAWFRVTRIPISPLIVLVVLDTTTAVGGRAAVVTTRVVGRRFQQLPQIPHLIQQTAHTGIMICTSMHVHTRANMITTAIVPVVKEATRIYT